jgi:hypothetical protein
MIQKVMHVKNLTWKDPETNMCLKCNVQTNVNSKCSLTFLYNCKVIKAYISTLQFFVSKNIHWFSKT